MNSETIEFFKIEIHDLLVKKLIGNLKKKKKKNSKSPWSCATFYVQKNAKIE